MANNQVLGVKNVDCETASTAIPIIMNEQFEEKKSVAFPLY